MMDQDAAGRQRLSEAVKKRRAELGFAMDALPHGPGEVTLRRIEASDPGGYRPKTLVQLDRSLGWNPGTSQAVLNGRYRPITDSPEDPGLGVSLATRPRSGVCAVGLSASSSLTVGAGTEPAAGIDPEAIITRDAAVQALLKYVEVLGSDRHRANPAAVAAQHEVLVFVHRLLDLIPTPEHIEWSRHVTPETASRAPEQEGGD